MQESCNAHIQSAFEMARRLAILADEGEGSSQDDGCALLFCVMRDCAYRIRNQAEREREAHQRRGIWTERGAG
jgi:hypothetical protein